MKNLPVKFNYHNSDLRVFEYNNEIYFVFQDIRRALEKRENIPDAIKKNTIYCKIFSKEEFELLSSNVSSFNPPRIICLTEAGLYEYISISNSKYAKPFKKNITEYVLPTIRKTSKINLIK